MSTPEIPPEALALVQVVADAIFNVTASQYTSVAGLAILVYDMFLTWDDEVHLVWSKRWNLVKVLYFINKYVPLAFLLSANFHIAPKGLHPIFSDRHCQVWTGLASAGQVATEFCATWILTLRVLALYGQIEWFPKVLYPLFFLAYGGCATIVGISMTQFNRNVYYDHYVHLCSVTSTPFLFRFLFIPKIGYETLITVLTLYKAVKHAKFLKIRSKAPLMQTLARDGIVFFLAIVGLRIFNCIVWFFLPQSLVYLGIYMLWSLVSVLVSRLLINLRKATRTDPFSTMAVSTRDVPRRPLPHSGPFGSPMPMGTASSSTKRELETDGGDWYATDVTFESTLEAYEHGHYNTEVSHGDPKFMEDTFWGRS